MNLIRPALQTAGEAERLAVLHSYEVLDTDSDATFDALARLAADLFGAPVAAVVLIDNARLWVKARYGSFPQELPLSEALWSESIRGEAPFVVEDATHDNRFCNNKLVTGPEHVRFSASAPLRSADGDLLGMLCVLDRKPRSACAATLARLTDLALGVVGAMELHRSRKLLIQQARMDPLTGVGNRRAFEEALRQAIGEVRSGNSRCAVLSVDVDHYKRIVDRFGMDGGDVVLRSVAERLREVARPGDFIARLDRDAFAILLPGIGSAATVESYINVLLAALSPPVCVFGETLKFRTSVGFAICPDDGRSENELIRRAVAAVHQAKTKAHGDHVRFNPLMDRELSTRREMEGDLRDAISEGSFTLYWQPIVGCQSGDLRGFEALLRWHRPGHGKVSPGIFVPMSEALGLFRELDTWVLQAACSQAALWPVPARLAVNISPAWFRGGGLIDVVEHCLKTTGLSSDRLELELTERVFVETGQGALDELRCLRALGVGLSLDDFGTGYSSLSYLKSYPFTKVKLDRGFVEGLGLSRRTEVIVRAVLQLGAGLNMTVCAEGISRESQLAALQAYGCDEVQGFLIGRPAPLSERSPWLYQKAKRSGKFGLKGQQSARMEPAC